MSLQNVCAVLSICCLGFGAAPALSSEFGGVGDIDAMFARLKAACGKEPRVSMREHFEELVTGRGIEGLKPDFLLAEAFDLENDLPLVHDAECRRTMIEVALDGAEQFVTKFPESRHRLPTVAQLAYAHLARVSLGFSPDQEKDMTAARVLLVQYLTQTKETFRPEQRKAYFYAGHLYLNCAELARRGGRLDVAAVHYREAIRIGLEGVAVAPDKSKVIDPVRLGARGLSNLWPKKSPEWLNAQAEAISILTPLQDGQNALDTEIVTMQVRLGRIDEAISMLPGIEKSPSSAWAFCDKDPEEFKPMLARDREGFTAFVLRNCNPAARAGHRRALGL